MRCTVLLLPEVGSAERRPERPASLEYYTILYYTIPYMLVCRHGPHVPVPTCIDARALMRAWSLTFPVPVPPIHSAHCTCTYMYRRTCAYARVVSCVSSTCADYLHICRCRIIVRDWSPCTIILSLRYVASQASSIHLPCHNVNKFVLIMSILVL